MYKIYLMKQITKDLKKYWRDIPCSWIGIFSTVKMSILPNWIYRFNAISVKILEHYFVNIKKLILQFIWKGKRSRIANTIRKERTNLEDTI